VQGGERKKEGGESGKVPLRYAVIFLRSELSTSFGMKSILFPQSLSSRRYRMLQTSADTEVRRLNDRSSTANRGSWNRESGTVSSLHTTTPHHTTRRAEAGDEAVGWLLLALTTRNSTHTCCCTVLGSEESP
jgi:hypothetical protein